MHVNDNPRAAFEGRWIDIAETLFERADRQARDISHNSARIEALHAKVSLIGWSVAAIGVIVLARL